MQPASRNKLVKLIAIVMLMAGLPLPIASILLSFNGHQALAHALLACEGIVIFVGFNALMAIGISARRSPYILVAWPVLTALIFLMFAPESWVPSGVMAHPLSTLLTLTAAGWALLRLERRRQKSLPPN
jgi:hypothetical protein